MMGAHPTTEVTGAATTPSSADRYFFSTDFLTLTGDFEKLLGLSAAL